MTTAITSGDLWGNGSFVYDRMGNLLSSTLGVTTRTFTHQGTTPRIATATLGAPSDPPMDMTYDAAGNELDSPAGDPGAGFAAAVYSPRNLLQSQYRTYDRCQQKLGYACIQPDVVEEWTSNFYDGRGVRVMSTRNIIGDLSMDPTLYAPVYFYTPELTMLNINTPGRTADVIWFGSRPVADHEGATVRYTFTDHLGTPILQTTATADIAWRVEYEPFGNVFALRAGADTQDQPLRFPGQQVVYSTPAGEESYNIFRWYRAAWGRYTQADPVGVPTYVYSNANPVGVFDPLGLYAIDKSGVKQIPNSNIAATCFSLGSACTTNVFAWLSCKCSCTSGGYAAEPTLHIKGNLYYYPGNPKSLKSKPTDSSVVDPASSIAHEWKWHLNLAVQAVDSGIKELEQKTFSSYDECQVACTKSYSPWVTSTFSSYLSYTQYVEEKKKQQPQPPY